MDALADAAVLAGMDGFHLADQELTRLGRRDRKRAPDTFDVDGNLALLTRLRQQRTPTIYAPIFNRDNEEPIGSANPVFHETTLVVTEGNYLLLERFGWQAVRPLLDDATRGRANLLVHLATTLGSPSGSATTTASSMSERPDHGSVD